MVARAFPLLKSRLWERTYFQIYRWNDRNHFSSRFVSGYRSLLYHFLGQLLFGVVVNRLVHHLLNSRERRFARNEAGIAFNNILVERLGLGGRRAVSVSLCFQ